MENLKMHSPDMTQENIARIRELFPNCVTEARDKHGKLSLAVDFDALRQELSGSIVEGPQERYRLDWPGKREAMLAANAPIAKTLRPCREESVDFDTTKNLFIEGDNLDALKLLQETYLGKVKMIYIDPPYNTGNDFIYNDDFVENSDVYLLRSNQKDEHGNRFVANNESNGQFHSDWMSMIFTRLKMARNLLAQDGVIFISIDGHEEHNLRKICDEIFGAENFRTLITWQRKYSVSNNYNGIANICDYILVYAKSEHFNNNLLPRTSNSIERYSNPDNDPRGPWKAVDYLNQATTTERPNLCYDIINPNTGDVIKNGSKAWKYDKSTHLLHVKENRIWWGQNGKNTAPALKLFLSEVRDGMTPHNWWTYEDVGHTQEATKELAHLMGCVAFDYPKPLRFLKKILLLASKEDSIILDFFSGSSTTAHAVMQLNAEDGGHRQFIMVQLPEACGEKSEAYKAGYQTIADISKERIRRAGRKIKEELAERQAKQNSEQGSLLAGSSSVSHDLDTGFRVLKVDSSNMADVFYTPDALSQHSLLDAVSNIKYDRTPEDLLFQVLLDWGVELTLPIRKETIQDKTVFFVDEDALVACFDKGITEDFVRELTAFKPLRMVFLDNGFASDAVKINAEQIFKQLSPSTEVRAL